MPPAAQPPGSPGRGAAGAQAAARALQLLQAGQLPQAEAIYRQLQARGQLQAAQLSNLAVICAMTGRPQESETLLEQAITLDPGCADAHANLGLARLERGDAQAALPSLEQAVALQPRHLRARIDLARAQRCSGALTAAISSWRLAVALAPTDAGLLLQLANTQLEAGDTPGAIGSYEQALQQNPALADAHANRGVALQQLDRRDEALAAFREALQLDPQHLQALTNLGHALQEQGILAEALDAYRRALALAPTDADLHLNGGVVLRRQGEAAEALAWFHQAVSLAPQHAQAWSNLGVALLDMGDAAAALEPLQRACELEPTRLELHTNLVAAAQEAGQLPLALVSVRQAQNLVAAEASVPGSQTWAAGLGLLQEELGLLLVLGREEEAEALVQGQPERWQQLLLELQLLPPLYRDAEQIQRVRQRYGRALEELLALLEGPQRDPAWQPALEQVALSATNFFLAYQMEDDRPLQERTSRLLRAILQPRLGRWFAPLPARPRAEVLRLGVASHHLHAHNGALWSLGWLEPLATDPRVSIVTYQLGPIRDGITTRFAALGQHRRLEISNASLEACVQRIHNDALDVLLYPDIGMDPFSRLLAQLRLAPLQLTGWGHPITSGSPAIDGYLSCEGMEPADGQQHYSETLVRLPHTGLTVPPPQGGWQSGDREAQALGLPKDRPLLLSMQSTFKYDPRYDELLVEIARRQPDALLLLVREPPRLAGLADRLLERLRPRFAAAGLELEQHLQLLPRLNSREVLALMDQVVLALDTPGWNGGNTSLQALSRGCPLVTLPGRFMRGRHSLAMLQRLGLPELIATDSADYVAIACRLAADPHQALQWRQRILERQALLFHDPAPAEAFRNLLLDPGALLPAQA